MALQRRLVVGLGTASSVFLVYLLCLRLESPLRVAPLSHSGNPTESSSFGAHSVEDSLSRSAQELSPESLKETSKETNKETDKEARKGDEVASQDDSADPSTANSKDKSITNNSTEKNTAVKPTTLTFTTPAGARTTTKPGSNQTTPEPKPEPKPGPKLGPTEPSFIGDYYYSEEHPPLTGCPLSIRKLVSQTVFGTRLISDVPVLQWSKHLSQDQYERLRQYPGAHGWGGLSYQTLVDTLSTLDSPISGLLLDDLPSRLNASQCIRCAVVGNGGILKDSHKGPEIDQHHYVFRTNGAIIKGFEQDVGSRTTHYTFSTNTLRNSLRSYGGAGYSKPPQSKETRYVFLPDHDRDYLLMKAAATHSRVQSGPEHGIDPAQFFGSDVTKEKLKMYHPDFIRYLRNRFLRSNTLNTKYKNIYRPSTGAVMLLAALHSCDQVSAYGFMTPDYGKYSDHYYDKTFHAVGFFINHDLRLEMSLWQQLHQAGLIHLYMHQDPERGLNDI